MNYQQYKPDFDRDGFIVVRAFLPPSEFQELQGNIDRYIREVVPTLEAGHAFYDQQGKPETLKQLHRMSRDPYFNHYMQHPRWITLAETLLGESVKPQEPEWFNKPAGTMHPTPPHQDNYYFNLHPPQTLTIWLALDVVDEENGCLRYVAGSHLSGVRPHTASRVLGFSQGIADYGPDDEAREVPVQLQPGDVVVHHCNTIHRAQPNRSHDRHRRAFAMVMRGVSCQRDEAGYQRYLAALKQQHETMGVPS